MSFHHISVMPQEVMAGLLTDPDGTYVDCTLGGGGHSAMLAAKLSAKGRIIGIDQDPAAIEAAAERLKDAPCRISLVRSNFSRLADILQAAETLDITGILFDLGVSSHQLDTPERGFSYMRDARLDMRMDPAGAVSAYEIINGYETAQLCRIFKEYGQERWAKRIAEFIADARQAGPIETTGELVDIICRAIPKAVRRREEGHPAKRVFQAVRIEVNDELNILRGAITSAVNFLRPGGRIAVISFHSLEDRVAKETLRELAKGCICPPQIPVCVCGHKAELKLLSKAIRPSREEIAANPRAKSAKLRLAEKL